MDSVDYLVVGAGVSGLSFANAIGAAHARVGRSAPSVRVLEAEAEPGGYCRTVVQDGFVWDYSGHFFHFRHKEIEEWLCARMIEQEVRKVEKRSFIRFAGQDVDFPFQKNIHQLPQADFIDCLYHLYFREDAPASSFKAMVMSRLGKGIAERFLIPYNEKLYACDLDELDADAMGRFFPHVEVDDVIRNMVIADNRSYNSSFTYPEGGAIQYIRALLRDLGDDVVALSEPVTSVDVEGKTARTPNREIEYRHLISSAPFPALLRLCGRPVSTDVFRSNKVLVFNLGFDRKGQAGVHWLYVPDPARRFYRVGYYDNILGGNRMSLYVEIGMPGGESVDVDAERERVLADLEAEGITRGHRLLSWHSVVLDPAYVHITRESMAEHARLAGALSESCVHAVGRYGGWTYCSIEDNILETRALAAELAGSG